MTGKVTNLAIARIAKKAGVSVEVALEEAKRLFEEERKQEISREVERQLAADVAERRRQPGRRTEELRDFWIMHQVEWHRAQGMKRKQALHKVGECQSPKLSPDSVSRIYKKWKYPEKHRDPTALEMLMEVTPLTDRELRERYRRDPEALLRLMKQAAEDAQKRVEAANLRVEELRRQEERK